MRGWKGIAAGALSLALFDAVVSRNGATDAVAGAQTGITKFVQDFLSPAVPAFATGTSGTSTSTASVSTANFSTGQPVPAKTNVPVETVPTFEGQPVLTA